MGKFDGVDREHMEKALADIDRPWPARHQPTAWWIKVGTRLYPLKYVLAQAICHAPGVRDDIGFAPHEAVSCMRRLQFEIVKKQ